MESTPAHTEPAAGQSLWSAVPPPPVLDPVEIERAITRVRGVQASRVEVGPGRQVHKVHAIADADRDPKQLVRDIESLLYALFRLRIDYRKISLVQVGEGQVGASLARVRLVAAACATAPSPAVRVTLRYGNRTAVGEAGLPDEVAATFAALGEQVVALERLVDTTSGLQQSLSALAEQTLDAEAHVFDEPPEPPVFDAEQAARFGLPAEAVPAAGAETIADTLNDVEARVESILRLATPAVGLREQVTRLMEQTLRRSLFPLGSLATVRAADELMGRTTGAQPLAVQLTTIGDDRAVIVTLDVPRGRGEQRVAGCALLIDGGDSLEAICRATLDALNRHLSVAATSGD